MAKKNVDESPMSKQYRELKAKHPDRMLLFRCGDFYETYEDDAAEAAKILGITLTYRNDDKMPMAGFPHHALDTYLPKLIRAGKRVAICDQLPDPPKPTVKRGETEKPNDQTTNNPNNQTTMATKKNNNETKRSAQSDACQNKNVQNAQVSNPVTTSVDVAEVDDIMPKVTSRAKSDGGSKTADVPQTSNQPAVTKPDPEAVGELAGMLTKVTLTTYKTKKGADAPIIIGFGGENDPRWKRVFDAKPKWASAGYRRDLGGDKTCHILFGTRYMEVARQLCEAYNTNDRKAWEKAEQACAANYEGIVSGYQQAKAERKAQREAAKAAREAKKSEECRVKSEESAAAQPAMDEKEQAMFELFKKFMAGDATAMQQVGAMMAKQAA